MATVSVTGETLGAAAAAARLAKLGHQVTYVGTPDRVGGHWREHLPPVLTLPATWRDLFRKTGRGLSAELARHQLELAPAPPAKHVFSDGLELELPTERGAQYSAISTALGEASAIRWRDLLDGLDSVWLTARQVGIEAARPEKLSRQQARGLWRGKTLASLAAGLAEPHLAQLVRAVGPRCGTSAKSAPALLATRLVVERTFGRWQLESAGQPVPATKLLDLLAQRLITRKVRFAPEPGAGHVRLDFGNELPKNRWRTRLRPAAAPAISKWTSQGACEVVRHTTAGPIIAWVDQRHDYTATRPNLEWGFAPNSWSAWLATPASACAGTEPWAELATAALAVYSLHFRLTGGDVRPTNRNYRP